MATATFFVREDHASWHAAGDRHAVRTAEAGR